MSKHPHLPCFDLPEFSKIWCDGKIQFKKDKYEFDGMKMEVEGEWLDGKPHGMCIFNIEKQSEFDEGQRGVLIFTHGNPVEAPCWVENKKDKSRASFETFFGKGENGIARM